jgi:hypothetical protein
VENFPFAKESRSDDMGQSLLLQKEFLLHWFKAKYQVYSTYDLLLTREPLAQVYQASAESN